MFIGFSAIAQTAEVVLETEFSAVTSFLLPAILSSLLALWMDTVKHIKAGTYDPMIALKTKIIPFVVTIALSVGIYYLLAYLPATQPFIETLAGHELAEVTAGSITGMASVIVDALYKTYFKTQEPAVATE